MLSQIFLFSSEEFVCSALSKALKECGCECFIAEENTNFDFYIEDMAPQAIIFDYEGRANFEEFLESYQMSAVAQKVPLIVLMEEKNISKVDSVLDNLTSDKSKNLVTKSYVSKPINPFELYEIIEERIGEK